MHTAGLLTNAAVKPLTAVRKHAGVTSCSYLCRCRNCQFTKEQSVSETGETDYNSESDESSRSSHADDSDTSSESEGEDQEDFDVPDVDID